MLVSTDPASNLQDVFETELNNKGIPIQEVPNLVVANFEPEKAATEYKESVLAPYRGKLPEAALQSMEEQLSGSCTVEIAALKEAERASVDLHDIGVDKQLLIVNGILKERDDYLSNTIYTKQ